MFNLDIKKVVLYLLPTILRKPRLIAFINALSIPFESTLNILSNYRLRLNKEVAITPQKCYLRKYLNDRFDVNLRRILIEDSVSLPTTFIYLESENNPKFLPFYLSDTEGVNFVVKVPISLQNIESQIIDFLSRYKLPSKTFRIEYI